VLADKGYDGFQADVWSCGVILYVLLAGFLPFDEPSMSALFRKIIKAEFSYPSWFSPSVKDILNKILVPTPEKRYTMEQIKKSEWFLEGGYEEEDESQVLIAEQQGDYGDFEDADEVEEAGENDVGRSFNPQTMNAFELITMCGGLDLTPMLDKTSTSMKKFTRFNSTLAPPVILAKVAEVLKAVDVQHKVFEKNFKIKVLPSPERGQLTCTVQIFTIAPGLQLVDWRRGQGDLMTYYKFYQDMRAQLGDVAQS